MNQNNSERDPERYRMDKIRDEEIIYIIIYRSCMKEKEYNRHHEIPSSKWGKTNEYNINVVEVWEHRRRHTCHENDTPVEAICRVLLWNEKVWTDNFLADMISLLDNYLNKYYNPKAHSGLIRSEVQKILELEKHTNG